MEDSGKTCSREVGEAEEKAPQMAWDRCLCEGVSSSREPTGVLLLGCSRRRVDWTLFDFIPFQLPCSSPPLLPHPLPLHGVQPLAGNLGPMNFPTPGVWPSWLRCSPPSPLGTSNLNWAKPVKASQSTADMRPLEEAQSIVKQKRCPSGFRNSLGGPPGSLNVG